MVRETEILGEIKCNVGYTIDNRRRHTINQVNNVDSENFRNMHIKQDSNNFEKMPILFFSNLILSWNMRTR